MGPEDVHRLIAQGEGLHVEFKRTPTEDLAEHICAFANAEGGYILIGVEDSGEIVGTDPEKAVQRVNAALQSIVPPPKVEIHRVLMGDRYVVVVEVKPSASVHMVGGVAYVRVGASKRPLSLAELLQLGAEYTLIPLDRMLTEYGPEDIWEVAERKFLAEARKRNVHVSDVLTYLRKVGAVGKRNGREKLSLAAALMFVERPQERYPQMYLRLVHGETWKRYEGPFWKIVEDVVRDIMDIVPKRSFFLGPKREDVPLFPERAVREAIVNALVHRNLGDFSEVFVIVEGNTLRIRNPGAFPPNVTPENPVPRPRNPTLYELMFLMGYVERQGRGIELIRAECARMGINVRYVLRANTTELIMTYMGGDERYQRVLDILDRPRPAREIAEALGVSLPTVHRILKRMEALGLIRREGKGPKTVYMRKI